MIVAESSLTLGLPTSPNEESRRSRKMCACSAESRRLVNRMTRTVWSGLLPAKEIRANAGFQGFPSYINTTEGSSGWMPERHAG